MPKLSKTAFAVTPPLLTSHHFGAATSLIRCSRPRVPNYTAVRAQLRGSSDDEPCSLSEFLPLAAVHHVDQDFVTELDDSNVSTDLIADGIVPPSGGGTNSGDGRDGNSGDSGGESQPSESDLSALLSENNATLADIPQDIVSAYKSNVIPLWAVSNYLVARANPISRIMLSIGPLRDRFLADKLFLLKILIEEGIGFFGKMSAEYQQRRSAFWREGEFVLANVIIAMLADFALVFFPAPSLSLNRPSVASSSGFKSMFSRLTSGLPSNIFQTDRPFTLGQRAGCFAFKFAQLFSVGFLCCFTGVVITNGLVIIREKLDSSYKPATSRQNPFIMSLLYATFLGASSGTRYQLVNGIENNIFPRIFHGAPALLEQAATFGLRYANTFWGSQQWVMFARFTKVQKSQ